MEIARLVGLLGWDGWGGQLAHGLGLTLVIAVLSFAAGTVFGLAGALLETAPVLAVRAVVRAIAAAVRSMPELLVILTFYFGGSALLASLVPSDFGLEISGFWSCIAAITLIQAAYAIEVFRGAFEAVPRGLREAGLSLGLPPRTLFRLVVLPLALRLAFPGLGNLWMAIVKTTPLVSVVGLQDFIRAAASAAQNTKQYLFFYGSVFVGYLMVSGVSMLGQALLERRIGRPYRIAAKT